jgi:demethylmenaquinone methyltransferase / 2-methoxy-6-polyprenyl-1,4-benzoquinol methylase
MANKFYDPGEQRAGRVHDLFAAVAPRYDLINDLQSFGLHRYWKRQVVKLARLQSGERALDLCCGTGDLAFALRECGASVAGLDFSSAMLKVAVDRRREAEGRSSDAGRNFGSLFFLRGDALRIPFADSQFDVVTIGYGLRNLADFRLGLSEMWRVLRPGGRLLVLDFGRPDNALWRGLYFGYLRWFVPWFGRIFCGDSETHAYILESLVKYPAQNGVAKVMAQMGGTNLAIKRFLGAMMTINYAEKPARKHPARD